MVVPVRVLSMGQIDLFKHFSFSIRLCGKKKKLTTAQKYKYECDSLSSRLKNIPRWVEMPSKSIKQNTKHLRIDCCKNGFSGIGKKVF